MLLALLAERASGVDFHKLVHTLVCEPAGMVDTAAVERREIPQRGAVPGARRSAGNMLLIATNATGAQPLVRDYGLLESAAARPRTNLFGTDAYPDIWAKAAALGHSLISNHPLLDGNKRLGWVAMRTFLELNDLPPLHADVDQAERFIIDIASGELDEVAEIAKRLRALAE